MRKIMLALCFIFSALSISSQLLPNCRHVYSCAAPCIGGHCPTGCDLKLFYTDCRDIQHRSFDSCVNSVPNCRADCECGCDYGGPRIIGEMSWYQPCTDAKPDADAGTAAGL